MQSEAPARAHEASVWPQLATCVLMIRPAAFGANPETAATNRFQALSGGGKEVLACARAEFESLVQALDAAGVEVIVVEDTVEPCKPDAVFPNNWVSTHADGTVVLYPMLAPSRRAERRWDVLEQLRSVHGRSFGPVHDLSRWEEQGLALEGTGSLTLDRRCRVAYACRSQRTGEQVLGQWAELLGYTTLVFDAVDLAGTPIYHTNVMMAIGSGFAVAALDAIRSSEQRRMLSESLEAGKLEVIPLSQEQVGGFGANLLHLQGASGPVIAMSARARESLGHRIAARLEGYGTLVSVPIPTIERYGGGSVRCMLTEIFLPRIRTKAGA